MKRAILVPLTIACAVALVSCLGGPGRCLGLYMNDGHFISRQTGSPESWGVDSVCDALILGKEIEPIIVVGITSSDSSRVYDYTPFVTPYPRLGPEGGGDRYLRAIRDTLKPTIDRRFATLRDPSHTLMMGASLGGLISVYAGYAYDGTFGRVAGISGSYSWDDGEFFEFVRSRGRPALSRLYLDSGTVADNLYSARAMRISPLSRVSFQGPISCTSKHRGTITSNDTSRPEFRASFAS